MDFNINILPSLCILISCACSTNAFRFLLAVMFLHLSINRRAPLKKRAWIGLLFDKFLTTSVNILFPISTLNIPACEVYISNEMSQGHVTLAFEAHDHWNLKSHWWKIMRPTLLYTTAWSPKGPRKVENPTWSPTWHAMDDASWSTKFASNPPLGGGSNKTRRPWDFKISQPWIYIPYCVKGPHE